MNPIQEKKAKGWFEIWKDNSDPEDINKGIISFARMCFPHVIEDKYGIPEVHKEVYFELTQLYNPTRTMYLDRQVQLELARDFAKSTIASFIFPAYILCMNGHKIITADTYDYVDWTNKMEFRDLLKSKNGVESLIDEDVVLVMSETLTVAEQWSFKLRKELSTNKVIIPVFGNMKPNSLRDDEGKWTATNFKVLKDKSNTLSWQRGFDATFVVKGGNQQARGINIDGRITTLIGDDLYSKKNTITPESRQKVRYLWDAEVKNGVDKNKGKILYIGTNVHEDTVVNDNERNRRYRVIKKTAMNKEKFMFVVNKYCKSDSEHRTCAIPNRIDCETIENSGYFTEWPKRLSLHILLSEYSECYEARVENRTLSAFWQEKFHEVMSEEDKKFKQEMFTPLNFELVGKEIGGNYVPFVKIINKDGTEEYRNVSSNISVDLASSYSATADDTAIIWTLKDYNNRVYFYRLKYGKLAISDEMKKGKEFMYLDKLCMNRSEIDRIGSIDEIFRWCKENPKIRHQIVIETNNVGSEAKKQAFRKSQLFGMYYQIKEVIQTQNKFERIAGILLPYHQAKAVYYNSNESNLSTLQYQLEYLSKSTHDDCADAAATGVDNLRPPTLSISWTQHSTKEKIQTYIQKIQNNINIKSFQKWRT